MHLQRISYFFECLCVASNYSTERQEVLMRILRYTFLFLRHNVEIFYGISRTLTAQLPGNCTLTAPLPFESLYRTPKQQAGFVSCKHTSHRILASASLGYSFFSRTYFWLIPHRCPIQKGKSQRTQTSGRLVFLGARPFLLVDLNVKAHLWRSHNCLDTAARPRE